MEEPIASIIWATPRLQSEVGELKVITDQLTLKYGKEFAIGCRNNALDNVNEKLMHKLGVQAPPPLLVEKYLEEIAKTYNVPFEPDPGVVDSEVLAAEGMLIDFGKGSHNDGGLGMATPAEPMNPPPVTQMPEPYNPPAPAPFSYPQSNKVSTTTSIVNIYSCCIKVNTFTNFPHNRHYNVFNSNFNITGYQNDLRKPWLLLSLAIGYEPTGLTVDF